MNREDGNNERQSRDVIVLRLTRGRTMRLTLDRTSLSPKKESR